MKRIILTLAALLLVQGVFLLPASANGGPSPYVIDGDAVFLVPQKSETIDVLSETLTYDIELLRKGESREGEKALAQVSASYRLRSSIAQTVQVAFVSNNSLRVPQVFFNGEAVPVLEAKKLAWQKPYDSDGGETRSFKREENWLSSWEAYGLWEPTFQEILHVIDKGTVAGTEAPTDYELTLTRFVLTVPENEESTLLVTYTERAAVISERRETLFPGHIWEDYYEFYYFLEPAQYWNSFSDLTVHIKVNGKLDSERTSLSGFVRGEEGDYSAHFDTLPDKNLRIVVKETLAPAQLVPPLILLGAMLCVVIPLLIRRRRKRKRAAEV